MNHFTSAMNSYLSDLVIFYLKLHDLHWNVTGIQFMPLHQYTESRYNDTAEKLDAIAELILMHGEKPVTTTAQFRQLSSIQELGQGSLRDREVLEILKKDMGCLKDRATEVRARMEADGLFDAVALLEEHIAGYTKELWFLSAMTAQ